MSPTITVRALDSNGEPRYGNGTADFISDAQAVRQNILTTILLLQGEWWINTAVGTPLFQALVSHPISNQAVALIYQNIILGVSYVTGITSLAVTYIPQSRSYSCTANVTTAFGAVVISG